MVSPKRLRSFLSYFLDFAPEIKKMQCLNIQWLMTLKFHNIANM